MGISEHLSAALASSYLKGSTSPGAALAVEVHLAFCEQCRAEPRLLSRTAPAAMPTPSRDLLDYILKWTDPPAAGAPPTLPAHIAAGPWRRLGNGVHTLALRGASGLGEDARLVMADRGAPLMAPAGAQLVVILRGGAGNADGSFERGDILEQPGQRLTRVAADGETGCLYLVVGDADMYPHTSLDLLGRIQSWVRREGPPRGPRARSRRV